MAAAILVGALLAALPSDALALDSSNNTPFRSSRAIVGARWASAHHFPPPGQFGDMLPTPWADDGNLYVLMDDGGVGTFGGALWRNSFARITGGPRSLQFQRIGGYPPPATWTQIYHNRRLWSGPLGSYYSAGFAIVHHVFYATQVKDWNWNANGPFKGLAGIAYSTDRGQHWQFPHKPFPGPTGNLNWVQWGANRAAPDGYVYAIATEREFNASRLILGRSRPDVAHMTDPSRWQWASGWVPFRRGLYPVWSRSVSQARPILRWRNHITYPRMTFDPGRRRYLLTFTYSYAGSPPGMWRNGSELVILEGKHPWGPFYFVARNSYFGPSNGYDPAFPVKWISGNGLDLWLIFAANFDGCAPGLRCDGAYGFNYKRIRLLVGSRRAGAARAARGQRSAGLYPPAPPGDWRGLPATPPRYPLPRLFLSPRSG
jgi:hypothetical protein